MRPRGLVQSVLLYNTTDKNGNWIPMKVELNSWVTLMPGKTGGHAKDALKHGGTSSVGAYKAKVLKFKMSVGAVSFVRIQHAYMWRQLDLDPNNPRLGGACNYLYPSHYEDWIDPKSILGVIVVIHADIGELTKGNRTHKELLEDSVYFYNASYIPRSSPSTFGQIQPIPLPSFDSPDWPLPDMLTTESFRAKFRLDFQSAMRPTTGSNNTHLSWFLPLGVFIDLFYVSDSIQRTATMYVVKYVDDDLCSSLMDGGWDSKITIGADIVKTTVSRDSLKFRYHIGKATLYANFIYNRSKMLQNSTWQAIDQYELMEMVNIHCEFEDSVQDLEVGLSWSFSNVRQEIQVQFSQCAGIMFEMWICDGNVVSKVNRRNEKNMIVENVLPPKKLRLIPTT